MSTNLQANLEADTSAATAFVLHPGPHNDLSKVISFLKDEFRKGEFRKDEFRTLSEESESAIPIADLQI